MKSMIMTTMAAAIGLTLSACSVSEPERLRVARRLPLNRQKCRLRGAPPAGGPPQGMPLGGMPAMPSVLDTDYTAAAFIQNGVLQDASRLDAFTEGSVNGSELEGVSLITDATKIQWPYCLRRR